MTRGTRLAVAGAVMLAGLTVGAASATAAPATAASATEQATASAPATVQATWRASYWTLSECYSIGDWGVRYGYWPSYYCQYQTHNGMWGLYA